MAAVDDAIAAGQSAAEDRRSGQMSIFGTMEAETDVDANQPLNERPLPTVPPWGKMRMLEDEVECLGFYVSGHPLDRYDSILKEYGTCTAQQLAGQRDDQSVILGGILNKVRPTVVRNGRSAGEKMAMITVQDMSGEIDGVVFSNVFARFAQHIQPGAIVLLVGRADQKRGEPQIIVDKVIPIEEAPRHLAGRLELEFRDNDVGDPVTQRLDMVAGLIRQAGSSGIEGQPAEVQLHLHTEGRCVTMRCTRRRVIVGAELLERLRQTLGEDCVRVHSAGPSPSGSSPHGRRSWQSTHREDPVEMAV